ncbi:unnamed protein product [Rhizoctonia solani]|uniref:WW domain-containing protein n=1 Tax=Rhizoctonia solani TaxID=456999 RepID=A0A8H3D553_9AGAM|nr:unnamed protein product [Rhizoctonia solani]
MQEFLSLPYLVECIPSNTRRYNDTSSVRSVPTVIPSALFEPQSFKTKTEIPNPDGWQAYVNPAEGRPYYWSPSLRIFTESNITEEHVLSRLIDRSRAMRPQSKLAKGRNTSSYDGTAKKTDKKAVVNSYQIPPENVAYGSFYQHHKIVFRSLGSYMGR